MKKNFTNAIAAFALLSVIAFALGCKKPVETAVPKVDILEQSAVVGYNTAQLLVKMTDDGGTSVIKRGVFYGEADGMMDTLFCDGGTDSFSVELTDLWPLTTYTCRAFAVNETGWGFSEAFSFTTLDYPYPVVMTYFPTNVTTTTAKVTGHVVSGGGLEMTERGICYSTEESVTIDDAHVVSGSGLGEFTCELTGLQPSSVYYARAYAISAEGVCYGEALGFVTENLPMEVRTMALTDVTATRAKVEGEVIRDGGFEVTESGFCWGTEHEPTIEGLHQKVSTGVGVFSSYFSGLERGRTNYVRAYAINEKGVVAYGEEVEFVPDDPSIPWPEGASPGLFSVSADRKVRFSKGNLQYYPDETLWRFAERQWDFVGGTIMDYQFGESNIGTVYANGIRCDNTQIWKYYEGWMDLFGWGTSGWDNGNEYYKPYNFAACEYHCASYGPVGNFDLTGDYAEADWGVHNTISNGGSRQWRTPTVEEFVYLLTERETPSGMLFASAVVAGVSGKIVFPDDWEASTYPINAVNVHCDFNTNIITGIEWLEILEPAGAVFLPAAGVRYQFTEDDGIWYDNPSWTPSRYGNYWTTTQSGVCIAHSLVILNYEAGGPFTMAGCIDIEEFRCNGCSVRLISEE